MKQLFFYLTPMSELCAVKVLKLSARSLTYCNYKLNTLSVQKVACYLFWQIKIFSKSFISRGIDASAFFYNKLGRSVRLFCPAKADKAAF